jgi:hypothetical protein
LGKSGLIGLKSGPLFPLNLRVLFQNFSFGTASDVKQKPYVNEKPHLRRFFTSKNEKNVLLFIDEE